MPNRPVGVAFTRDESGSVALHRIADELTQTFPELTPVPGARRFRRLYHDWLPDFEASRLMSPRRGSIARRGAELFVDALQCNDLSLAEACARAEEPVLLESLVGTANPTSSLELADGTQLGAPVSEMWQRGQCSRAVVDAIQWAEEVAPGTNLMGSQFVLLGAGAQLAPTQVLLEAGAEVLWVDIAAPKRQAPPQWAGTLRYAPGGLDLLESPGVVRATIEAFARGPVHLGLFAYAAGGAREWRLCGSMNALVGAIPKELVKSISLLLSPASPTTPAEFRQPAKTTVLKAMPEGRGGRAGDVARNVVPVQGVSYQAAQYLGKRFAAEAWAAQAGAPVVSANMAGITRSRSTEHPLFTAAFSGAHHLGVRIFEPELTTKLSAWLMLHDLFASQTTKLFDKQVHGGVLGLPISLNRAISAAATVGLARHPRLLGSVLRGR